MRTVAILGVWLATIAVARADGDELRARGEALARDGRYTDAIDQFKAADRVHKSARNACLIALAYTRRESWPQAEIAMDACHQRATPDDPLPDWVPEADALIAKRLHEARIALVEIHTLPTENVSLVVSSFAPDEVFAPRTIHLGPGHHTIIASARGYEPESKTIEVADDLAPQRVVIRMYKIGERPKPPVRNNLPTVLLVGGAGVALAGGAVHLLWYRGARDDLAAASDHTAYVAIEPRYDVARALTIGLYGLGGAALLAGVILRARGRDDSPVITGAILDRGAMVSVAWQR